jgi:hypothetical protein
MEVMETGKHVLCGSVCCVRSCLRYFLVSLSFYIEEVGKIMGDYKQMSSVFADQ